MLKFRYRCPCCRHVYAVPFSAFGQVVRCPQTSQPIRLPPRASPPPSGPVDWAAITEPDILLEVLSGLGGRRERRLALVAVGRAMLGDDEPGQRVAEVAERLADGSARPAE